MSPRPTPSESRTAGPGASAARSPSDETPPTADAPPAADSPSTTVAPPIGDTLPTADAPTAIDIDLELDPTGGPPGFPVGADLRRLVECACACAGVHDGHVAITVVEADDIHVLNREHRDRDRPTDVLSFPIDGAAPTAGPRELGDVVVCPEHTVDLREAVVHGILHLVGYDHETDAGEMLALQAEILRWFPAPPASAP